MIEELQEKNLIALDKTDSPSAVKYATVTASWCDAPEHGCIKTLHTTEYQNPTFIPRLPQGYIRGDKGAGQVFFEANYSGLINTVNIISRTGTTTFIVGTSTLSCSIEQEETTEFA